MVDRAKALSATIAGSTLVVVLVSGNAYSAGMVGTDRTRTLVPSTNSECAGAAGCVSTTFAAVSVQAGHRQSTRVACPPSHPNLWGWDVAQHEHIQVDLVASDRGTATIEGINKAELPGDFVVSLGCSTEPVTWTQMLKTRVLARTQTLQARQLDEAKRNEFYGIMLADSDRLLGTIDQVLRAARTSSSKRAVKSPVDLSAIVRECVELARTRHHLPEGAVNYRESIAPATVLGDSDELKAAVSNLIDNAVKYSSTPVSIAVELKESETGRLHVRVQDNGVGIADTELTRIFKRFYRIPGSVALKVNRCQASRNGSGRRADDGECPLSTHCGPSS
ncbi:MAG: HAMP domain-containing histidine kinase [Clostridia bacterium]|nr:HAMP domain-containing histidine kinase [Deltaproteobacteria bacterium]